MNPRVYAMLPMAAETEATPEKPMMMGFKAEEGPDRIHEEVRELREAGAPIIWKYPFGLIHRNPVSIHSATVVGEHHEHAIPYFSAHARRGDIAYLGSPRTDALVELLYRGEFGSAKQLLADSIAPVLDVPGVSICLDSTPGFMLEHPELGGWLVRQLETIAEELMLSNATLYLEPRPHRSTPQLNRFGWVSRLEHWQRGHQQIRKPAGAGVVIFHDKTQIKTETSEMRRAFLDGLSVALHRNAFKGATAAAWEDALRAPTQGEVA